MGATVTENTDSTNGEIDSRTAGGHADSNSTSATTSRTSETGGTAGGTNNPTDGGKTEEKGVVIIPVLNEEETPTERRNRKKRERYHAQKQQDGEISKPRKVNSKKTETVTPFNDESLSMLIMTVSSIVASKPNMSHWLLSESEVKSIVKPLTEMMKQSSVYTKINENSNQIALVLACVTIFVPRIAVTVSVAKSTKKQNVKKPMQEVKQNAGETNKTDRDNVGNTTNDSKAPSINDVLSVQNMGVY